MADVERRSERQPVRVLPPLGPYALRVLVLALTLGGLLTLWPLWAPLVLAAWFSQIVRPLQHRLADWMGKNERGAAVATVLLVIVGLAPITVVLLSLAADAIDLVQRLVGSEDLRQAAAVFINGDTGPEGHAFDVSTAMQLARRHGLSALGTAGRIAGATTTAVIGVVVFLYGFYVFLAHGRAIYEWLCRHVPLDRRDVSRLASAFTETGRGLIIGFGLTALLQGSVATVGYLVIGLPHALVLGLLTAVASLIPAVGTGLVWVPLGVGLALTGNWGQAIAVVAVGTFISLADNFVRPALSRYGKLQLPMFALFVGMVGGLAAFGGWGLILGPLLLRLAAEGLDLLRERRGPEEGSSAASA